MPGLLRGLTRTAAVAGTATAVSRRVSRRQQGRWAKKDQEKAQAQEPAPQAAAPPAAAPDQKSTTLDQLKELGELKKQGVLTDEEFASQKSQILDASS
jgi:hypothetical protein